MSTAHKEKEQSLRGGARALADGGVAGTRRFGALLLAVVLLLGLSACSGKSPPSESTSGSEIGHAAEAITVGPAWPAEVIVATNSVNVRGDVVVTGDIAVTRASPGPVLAQNAEIVLADGARVNGSLRGDTLFFNATAHVTGTIRYNSWNAKGIIDGAKVTPLALPLAITLPAFPTFTAGTTAVTLAKSEKRTLAAGSYGAVLLKAGTTASATVLTLSGGTYQFASVDMNASSTIQCAAQCEIRVKGRIDAAGSVRIVPGAGVGIAEVRIFVEGANGGAGGPTADPPAVSVGADGVVSAYLDAPNGTVMLKGTVGTSGKVIARDVQFGASDTASNATLPVITSQPANVTVNEHNQASFLVAATGQGLLYQWQKNGVNIAGATATAYVLASASTADNGARFRCIVSNAAGSVASNEAVLTVRTCAAVDVTCDGIDDDCDSRIDDDYASVTTQCGTGACARSGQTSCVSGHVVDSCAAGPAAPNDATCNGVDDDCDGTKDEDYVSVPTACGIGACAAVGATSCVLGAPVSSCHAGTPAANDTTCNGVDDDCDGAKDEDYVSVPTACGIGACAAVGVTSCVLGAPVSSCHAGTPAANDATCNGVDDDCDGATDEDYAPVPTSCGVGACARTGSTSCVSGTAVDGCHAGTAAPNDATCNGVDDDCDGTRDEDYVPVTSSCGVGACASTGTSSCVAGAVVPGCHAGTPGPSDATCNGVDDDCDGATDEEYVPVSAACGTGACASTGTSSCVAGAIVPGCHAGTPAPTDATCNGVDDDCDGTADEDYVPRSTTCGQGACGATGATSCVQGAEQDSCTPGSAGAGDATCDGIDGDCDGQIDENYQPHATTCGLGACASTGTSSCAAGHELDSCHPTAAPAPTDTTCNGVDDDCDGQVDEDYVSVPTHCGLGACEATGHSSCVLGHVLDSCAPGVPAANDATCNLVDDDCDGAVDEDYAPRSTACGIGICASSGTTACVLGAEIDSCHAGTGAGNDATCNGVDDDCDGTKDEDYAPHSTTCGAGACASAGATSCAAGAEVDSCHAGTAAGSDATCNGVDDDCDGATDEDYVPRATTCGLGACASAGTTSCAGGSETDTCHAGTAAASDATCNGVDDDCDGATDEDYVSHATTCGAGACSATGTTSCAGGAVVDSCHAGTAAGTDATCNGVDDDCDGTTDEDYVPHATSCGIGACSATGSSSCTGGVEDPGCHAGTAAASDATCNGVDDDCDGATDEDYAPHATSCGAGACSATGTSSCTGGLEDSHCHPGTPGAGDATCNGQDDDCDGVIDEDFAPATTSCGVGACASTGTTSCQGGVLVNGCHAGTAAPSDATCNGVDDDCDGTTDEDYVPETRGCGVGACARTSLTACVSGAVVDSCSPGTAAGSDATCNGVDDDCDGTTDEDYASSPTTCGLGACAATGSTSCAAGHVVDTCHAGTAAPNDATCNGVDDDCDGSTDEDYAPVVTTCGVGACASSDLTSCVSGAVVNGCHAGTAAPSDATCNGVDDDCDGLTDEDYAPVPSVCGVGACASTGVVSCSGGSTSDSCHAGTAASGDATCNGVDDDCDGATDEDYSSHSTTCGQGACSATGATSCVGGSVVDSCTAGSAAADDATCDGIDGNCNGQVDENYQPHATACGVGACAATGQSACVAGHELEDCHAGTAGSSDATCNGVDDDCDGLVDEDYVSAATTCGTGACAASGHTTCVTGHVVDSCAQGTPAASDATCNLVDDDCDGLVDEDYAPRSTTCGAGACASSGTTSCVLGAEIDSCHVGTPLGSDAVCNGVDDDCDGSTDEDYTPHATSCGVGACSNTGVTSCASGVESNSCTPGTAGAGDATCNLVDDDCDGLVDEDYAPHATSCGTGACARAGQATCVLGHETNDCTPGSAAPSDTTCNGVDDDCDGATDEDYVSATTTCGTGACAATGHTSCVSGGVVDSCQAGSGAGSETACNGVDDDCDGAIDEDYVPRTTSCGVGACAATGTTSCVLGAESNSCQPGSAAAPNDVTCNGVDDDCDGSTDEDYAPTVTNCGVGVCASTGHTACVSGAVTNDCQPGNAAAPDDATCNGLDDDCDGSTDENYVSHPTSCGIGACVASGTSTCTAGSEHETCTPGVGAPNDVTCNGVDDDCDGTKDEDYPGHSTSCGLGACASTGTTSCVVGVVVDGCTAGFPAANDATCNGVDDDCDGTKDEDYGSQPTTCGSGACAATGTKTCQGGTEHDSCTSGTAGSGDATCNGVDDDCDGQIDEDATPQPTTCGLGACAATGTATCTAGHLVDTCAPHTAAANDATCNGVDDDCNGSVDEDFTDRCNGTAIEACSGGHLVTTECSDGNVCNGQESCSGGTCVPGTPATLDDGNPCTNDACSSGTGVTHTPKGAGTSCGPSEICDAAGACVPSVGTPPSIQTQPLDVTVSAGASFQFTVVATGSNLEYQWQRFGADLPGATAATYTNASAAFSDGGGEYRCIVRNAAGAATSSVGKLTVSDNEPPVLSVDGPSALSTTAAFATLTGVATDSGSGIDTVAVSSSRFPGQSFGAVIGVPGNFSVEAPLSPGDNALVVKARDKAGNEATRAIVVTQTLTTLPIIAIVSPATGSSVTTDTVSVSGTVRSSLAPEQIRLSLGAQVVFPVGTAGFYTFAFAGVRLVTGPNTLVVVGTTPQGTSSAETTVQRSSGTGGPQPTPPRISVTTAGSGDVTVTGNSAVVAGTVQADVCVQSVAVNGTPAHVTGGGPQVSFDATVPFASGVSQMTITVQATDCGGLTSQVTYIVRRDGTAPVIDVLGLQTGGAVNAVVDNPYDVRGTVTEPNLAGLAANDQSVGVLPGTAPDTWDFSFGASLVRGVPKTLGIEAWDHAGNRTHVDVVLRLDATASVTITSPSPGADLVSNADPLSVSVSATLANLGPTDTVVAILDGGAPVTLSVAGDLAAGVVPSPQGTHALAVEVQNGGQTVARSTVSFKLTPASAVPLKVASVDPPNAVANVEVDRPIAITFNKPITPALLTVEVTETVHGPSYQAPDPGTDISGLSVVQFENLNRDHTAVPGGVSFIPGDTLVAFYPQRNYGYAGTVYVAIKYDGNELLRTSFQVRPLPTLLQGFVAGTDLVPLEGVTVELDDGLAVSVTDVNGAFGFGFGAFANAIGPGRHHLRVNPKLGAPRYGSLEQWVNAPLQRVTSLGLNRIPTLDAGEPFRHVRSGAASVLFLGTQVELGLANAQVLFPGGAPEGDVHVQLAMTTGLAYPAQKYAIPHFAYVAEPGGVTVSGEPTVTLALPAVTDGYSYVEHLPDHALLVGLDPVALELVPVGVVRVDKPGLRVVSEGHVALQRLDYLAVSLMPATRESTLAAYGAGQIDLRELTSRLAAAQ